MSELYDEVARAFADLRRSLIKTGTVTGVPSAQRANVKIGDSTLTALPVASSYSPAQGHTVKVLCLDPDAWLVLCRVY